MKWDMAKTVATLMFVAALIPTAVWAQDYASNDEFTLESRRDGDSTAAVQSSEVRRLLPSNLSWMERGLWGESGLVRKVGIASPLSPETRKGELAVRRTMLTAHQIGGLVTLGLLGATVYYGQRTLDQGDPRNLRRIHSNLVTASIISYSVTGLLAVLSPPPLIRRDEFSTTTIHKLLAWVHFAGMVVTPMIGMSLRHSMNYNQLVRFHQISAYITTAALAASFVVVTF